MDIYDANTCYPAKVISFDPVRQVVSARVAVEEYYRSLTNEYLKQPAPVLVDVPVMISQGGGWDITFPIKEGDDCLLLFSQKGYDHWLYDGKMETGLDNGVPTSDHYRHFDIRDAIAIVGIRPIPRAIQNYNNDGMELRNEARSQRITFHSNGDVEINTTANVNVHCAEANVNASSKAVVTTPDMTIDSPITKLTGNLNVSGTINVEGVGGSGTSSITGLLNVSEDVVGGGVSLKSHKHMNRGLNAPTSSPI
jgi:hypothetical protein